MELAITDIIGLLVIAIIVALVARRLRLPYTVGLVVTGIGLTLARLGTHPALTHDFIFDVILPPLLFEAAINIRWKELRRDALPVLLLAIAGTVLAAAVVTAGMVYALHWPLPSATMFGVLIAATDPVAVIAMFKDSGVKGRLRLLVESESLFNDGVAAVLFTLALGFTQGGNGSDVTALHVAWTLVLTVGGGIAIGVATGLAAVAVAGRTSDHLIEATLTTIAAYGSFRLAEQLGCSGVLAAVIAGLVIGNLGIWSGRTRTRVSEHGRDFLLGLWDFAAFVANSLVFLLIGLTLAEIPFGRLGLPALAITITLTLVARAATVYPLSMAFSRSRQSIPIAMQHVLWWGGLRGALGLALALSLPPSIPMRDEILIATFSVVAFSVVAQGISMPWLLRILGFSRAA